MIVPFLLFDCPHNPLLLLCYWSKNLSFSALARQAYSQQAGASNPAPTTNLIKIDACRLTLRRFFYFYDKAIFFHLYLNPILAVCLKNYCLIRVNKPLNGRVKVNEIDLCLTL